MAGLIQIERITKRDLHAGVRELSVNRPGLREPQLPLHLLSVKLAERMATAPDAPIPDCLTCGVCCLFALIVPVTHAESLKIPAYTDILLDDSDEEIVIDRMLPRASEGRCANLEGTFGVSIGCHIYNDRPQVCRDFDAGSDRCYEFRRMYGLEPQLSDHDVNAALLRLNAREPRRKIEDVAIVSTGRIERSSFSVTDGTVEHYSAEQLTIVAFLDDDEPHELHTFESGKEHWFESDLLGLTLEQARKRIQEQAGF
jgi:Fe-S-cluster containining protein